MECTFQNVTISYNKTKYNIFEMLAILASKLIIFVLNFFRQEGTNRIISLKQSKHSLLGDNTRKEQIIWKIPVTIISNGGKEIAKVIIISFFSWFLTFFIS